MQSRHVSTERRGEATIVAVAKATLEGMGEWDYPDDSAVGLLDEFARAVAGAPAGVVVDVRDTEVLNHASVAVVSRLARMLAEHNRPRVICCSRQVKEILDLCRVNSLYPCRTSLEEALAELGRGQQDLA
jgi:hypothetical protein